MTGPFRRSRRASVRDVSERRVALLLLLLAIGCGGEPREVWIPLHRFADASVGGAPVATATVAHRVRPVLQGHPFAPAHFAEARRGWQVEPGGDERPGERRAWRESAPVEVPSGAVLEFGLGFAGKRPSVGEVGFEIDACRGEDCSRVFEEWLEPGPEPRWHDRRADLSSLAGQERSFRFRVRHRQASAGDPSLPVWSSPTIYARRVRRENGPNLLLISVDTLRADHLGSYGYPLETDPFLREAFAEGGTLFETCISSASSTGPSHMTMFTSLDPTVHGVLPTASFGTVLPRGVVTLASALRSAGLTTGAVTEDGPLGPARGFARGFDDFAETVEAGRTKTRGRIARTLELAEAWLRRNGDKRFFLFVHTYEVHAPYTPPDPYADLFAEAPSPQGFPPHWNPILYDREIRHTDDRLRDFFAFLEDAGLLRDTLVVLTSDHGEAFLEHGFFGHGPDVHEEILRVPLMLRGPLIPAGQRIPELVGLVDLMPTLLELLGVAAPAGLMGRSAAGLVRGDDGAGAGWSARPLYSGAWVSRAVVADGRAARVRQPTHAVRVDTRKLIRKPAPDGFHFRYYDLATDPGERSPSGNTTAGDAGELRALLEEHEARVRARREALVREPGSLPAELELGPEREERLRELGYLE